LFALVIACCTIAFLAAFVWALAPETSYDALNYHLGVPRIYTQNHALVEAPYTFWSYLLGNTGMLYAMALSLTGQPLPQLVHLLFGLLLAFMTFLFGLRLANARVGLLSAMLVYILPLVTWESRTAYIDLIVAVYAFGSVYAVTNWFQKKAGGWLAIAGLMCGFAVAAKLNVVTVVIPVALVVVCRLASRSFSWRDRSVSLLRLAIPAMLVSAPWFVTRAVWTGNPVFPFLNSIFRSPLWSETNESFNFSTYGKGNDLVSLLRLPWDITVDAGRFNEGPEATLGALPLFAIAALPLLAHRKNRRVMLLPVLFAFSGVIIWFETAQISRFLLMFAPIAALMGGLAFEEIHRQASGRKVILRIARVIAVILLVSLVGASGLVVILFGRRIPERFPYRAALGIETRERFLSRSLPIYDALVFLNSQEGGGAKVLSIGNELRFYTTAQIEGISGSRTARRVLDITDGAELSAFLRDQGYQYILINQSTAQRIPGAGKIPILRSDFLSRHAQLQFGRNNVFIYKVLPVEAPEVMSR
jgi:hypothetical protein